jgi:hypothetical protein
MIFIILSVLVQIFCAVHIVRNGRNPLWLTVVIFLSIPGCLAYLLLEVLPNQRSNRAVRGGTGDCQAECRLVPRTRPPRRSARGAGEGRVQGAAPVQVERAVSGDMYGWADRTLAGLRG